MYYATHYSSPLGLMMLASDGRSLLGLWIEGQKYHGGAARADFAENAELAVFTAARQWLDKYFSGQKPALAGLPLAPQGGAFRQNIWDILCEIPYGQTTTYAAIGQTVAARLGKSSMSAQAVGGAVGHNPISVIIPCHRVVGANGSLTGYAGGLSRKIKLLEHEGVDMTRLFVPAKGTAL